MNHNVMILRVKGSEHNSVAYGQVYEYTYPDPLEIGDVVEVPFGGGIYEGEVTDKPAIMGKLSAAANIRKILLAQPSLVVCV